MTPLISQPAPAPAPLTPADRVVLYALDPDYADGPALAAAAEMHHRDWASATKSLAERELIVSISTDEYAHWVITEAGCKALDADATPESPRSRLRGSCLGIIAWLLAVAQLHAQGHADWAWGVALAGVWVLLAVGLGLIALWTLRALKRLGVEA